MLLPSIRRVVAPSCLILVLAYGVVAAPPAGPEPITGADYPNAFKYTAPALRSFVYDTAVNPGWIAKGDNFWYAYRTSQGTRYWKVDPHRGVKDPLFDHEKLAALLSEETHKPVEPADDADHADERAGRRRQGALRLQRVLLRLRHQGEQTDEGQQSAGAADRSARRRSRPTAGAAARATGRYSAAATAAATGRSTAAAERSDGSHGHQSKSNADADAEPKSDSGSKSESAAAARRDDAARHGTRPRRRRATRSGRRLSRLLPRSQGLRLHQELQPLSRRGRKRKGRDSDHEGRHRRLRLHEPGRFRRSAAATKSAAAAGAAAEHEPAAAAGAVAERTDADDATESESADAERRDAARSEPPDAAERVLVGRLKVIRHSEERFARRAGSVSGECDRRAAADARKVQVPDARRRSRAQIRIVAL